MDLTPLRQRLRLSRLHRVFLPLRARGLYPAKHQPRHGRQHRRHHAREERAAALAALLAGLAAGVPLSTIALTDLASVTELHYVIAALAANDKHVPYRNSVLTRLLQNFAAAYGRPASRPGRPLPAAAA